jgi:hypothetical protein
VIAYRLAIALIALGVSMYLWHWRRKSRAAWKSYDTAHHGEDNPLRPTDAADRVRYDRD